ncbi:DUF1380 family protein [Lelliottia nimipressuralis]
MFGTREELCVQLENMFTFDEPLILLVWTEEGVSAACRESGQHPDEKEVWSLMKTIGDMPMAKYRREGITCDRVCELLMQQREDENRQVSVTATLLSRVLKRYASDLENRVGHAWEAGRQEPDSLRDALRDVHSLQEQLAA